MITLEQIIHEQVEDIKALASKIEAQLQRKSPKQKGSISNELEMIQEKLYWLSE